VLPVTASSEMLANHFEEPLTGNGVLQNSLRMFIPMEAPMRIPVLAMLTIAAAVSATPALAQTYDPKYPVCLQVYQGFTDYYFECAYTSLAQCNMSASGRAASCVVNPYYAGGKAKPRKKQRRAY
jgi:hypothetical protein